MNAKIVVVEPDPSARSLMAMALAGAGHPTEPSASVADVKPLLDQGLVSLAIVDEGAGGGALLEEVRLLRELYPLVPVIVTGTLLSQPVLLALLHLGVDDALPKPFTPSALREAVERSLARRRPGREGALEYAAAMAMAKEAIDAGRLDEARVAVARAQAASSFDAEAMATCALIAELSGDLDRASRGYRAALALIDDEWSAGPDPLEGLSRIDARRTPALDERSGKPQEKRP